MNDVFAGGGAKAGGRDQYISHLEARCNTLEARLARYRARKTWPRRLWRWVRRQAADYRIRPQLRRLDDKDNPGYFPRTGRPGETGER